MPTSDVLDPYGDASTSTAVPAQGAPAEQPPPVRVSRRRVLRIVGLGAATLAVAGTGVASYRVFDTAALDPGGGHAYDPWRQWQDAPGLLGAVGAAVLAANRTTRSPGPSR